MHRCPCQAQKHEPQFIAVTGGPGAGKTAVLEIASRALCKHVGVLPEAAGIVFGGGFPRHRTAVGARASQRAIYRVQREVERLVVEESTLAIALCDRGTIDGLAYWPDDDESLWDEVGTSHEKELARYSAVIHLQTPTANHGYNRENHLRIENAEEARVIDEKIRQAWAKHPRRYLIPSSANFMEKAVAALQAISELQPDCCAGRDAETKHGDPG